MIVDDFSILTLFTERKAKSITEKFSDIAGSERTFCKRLETFAIRG